MLASASLTSPEVTVRPQDFAYIVADFIEPVVVPATGTEPVQEERDPWKVDPNADLETVMKDLRELLGRCSLSPTKPKESELQHCSNCLRPRPLGNLALCQDCIQCPPPPRDDHWPKWRAGEAGSP